MVQRPPSGVSGGTLPSGSSGFIPGHVFKRGHHCPHHCCRRCRCPHAWPPCATCLHAVQCVCARVCVGMADGRDRGVLWAHIALCRASVVRAGGRDAPHRLSCACVRPIAMLSVRVPVHGVGESDRPNRVCSDMKCIFCEYLRPFAARGEHAIARACDGKARRFMVSQACK